MIMCNDCNCKCPKPVPHKHAEVIKAWADGRIVQINCGLKDKPDWVDLNSMSLNFHPGNEYRVKPEPKPDVVRYAKASFIHYNPNISYQLSDNYRNTATSWTVDKSGSDNIKATWDGETGALKSVEIIK